MDDGCQLCDALTTANWDRVDRLLDDAFFAYLLDEPALLRRAFDTAPADWYTKYPRNILRRAIAGGARQPVWLIDDQAQADFAQWVRAQERPATRDLLKVRQASLRTLLESGRYQDASDLADEVWELVRTAPDTAGFRDVLPPVLIRAGAAKLAAADLPAAMTHFSEAIWWADTRTGHPFVQVARDHLALTYALTERFQQAAALLEDAPPAQVPPGTARYHYQSAGVLARLLVTIGSCALEDTVTLWDQLNTRVPHRSWWWAIQHARANVALVHGTQRTAAHELCDMLLAFGARAAPDTAAGTLLRCDLATLYQSVGDLRAAETVLHTPNLVPKHTSWGITAARQELLRGRPEQALTILRRETTDIGEPLPAWHRPSGSVLYAAAELASSGTVSQNTLNAAAAAMNTRNAYGGIMQAPPELRTLLLPLLDTDPSHIPTVFTYHSRIRLTRREHEILRLLHRAATVNDIAAELYISPNTAKTHLRALYRKLGAHTREDALWLGANID